MVRTLLLFLFCLFLTPAGIGMADPGRQVCPPSTLPFGMSTALTGPAARLGLNMRLGVLVAFSEQNVAGGIHGKALCLSAIDDGYEPERVVPNMHTLIQEENVLAVVGNVGTPTAVVAEPIAARNSTLFFGAYSGAGVLRKMPPERYVINYRASYAEETAAMVEALMNFGAVQPEEIAFFTQRDAFGDAGFSGGVAALRRHGFTDEQLIVHGRYERNTTAVENGLADILMAKQLPKAVILVGAYEPCATFIKLARACGLQALFLNVSFVGAAPLAEKLGEDGEGVIITQVVPHYDSEVPLVVQFRQALSGLFPFEKPTFGALEGYVVGRILIRSLVEINGPVTRETVVEALEGLGEFDIGLGGSLALSREEHQASHRVWPTVIRGGKVVPCNWNELVWKK